jgi:Na+-driven multidrug efflux pump
LPSWGLGNAAATLVGQNLGAGKADRAERSTWIAARYNTILQTIVGVALLLFAPNIAGLFSNDAEVIKYASSCLRILAIGAPAYAIGMIVTQALNGAGDTMTPTAMNFVCFWVLQIPLAYWLATDMSLGPNGAFTAIVVSESALTILSVFVFRRGKWKHSVA